MKRQRGRGRGKPGGGNQGNRSFESNGPEVKIRGNAATIYEKYMQLARDATSSGDRVRAENLQQHAEHYFRILQATQPQRRDNSGDDGGDDNTNDRDGESRGDNRGRNRQDGNRNDNRGRNRNDSGREDGDDDNSDNSDNSGRNRQRGSEASGDDQDRPPRRSRRQPRPERDPLEVVNPEGEQPDSAQPADMGEEQPKPKARRGRKPKSADDGAAQKALDDASDAADSKPGEAA